MSGIAMRMIHREVWEVWEANYFCIFRDGLRTALHCSVAPCVTVFSDTSVFSGSRHSPANQIRWQLTHFLTRAELCSCPCG
jgi:hypothetical protein